MSKLSILFKSLAVICVIVVAYACKRDDAEPEIERAKFSRLYVSFEEYQSSNTGRADTNVRVIYPADSIEFKFAMRHISQAEGGATIYFNPYLRHLIQASANKPGRTDTAVYMMSLGEKTGLLTNSNRLGNQAFSFVRGLTYHPMTQSLYVVESQGINAGIYVINRPANKRGHARPIAKFKTPGLETWGAVIANERIFVSNTKADAGIYVFDDMLNKIKLVNKADSSLTIKPDRHLLIKDAQNLRGMAYDTLKNVLAVVDYPNGNETVGAGRVLIFDNFSSMINQAEITPSRIITGVATLLEQPTDVALDTRKDSKYLYVADRRAKKVMRFKSDGNGNIAPDKVIDTQNMGTPVGLALDTRDESTFTP